MVGENCFFRLPIDYHGQDLSSQNSPSPIDLFDGEQSGVNYRALGPGHGPGQGMENPYSQLVIGFSGLRFWRWGFCTSTYWRGKSLKFNAKQKAIAARWNG